MASSPLPRREDATDSGLASRWGLKNGHQCFGASGTSGKGCRRLPFQEQGLRKLPFTADLERSEVLVASGSDSRHRFRILEILGGDLTISNAIEEMLAETRWKIGPPNLWHLAAERHARQLFLQALPLGRVGRLGESSDERENRSFSVSLDWRPASIKSTRTRLALVFRVSANVRARLAIPAGIETL
jgi:hypothetical protein